MAMELKIISPTPEGFVKEILWNSDEISQEIDEKIGYYKNLVYTEEQVVEAKKDRAKLNKFAAALKAKDGEIKKLCLQPYDEFHKRMQQIISKVQEPAEMIDKQVKDFEDQQKAEKRKAIQKLFDEKGFQPWVTLDRIWNSVWLNKSYSLKKVDADLTTIQHSIGEDILIINQMGEGQPAALREYQRSMDKTKAVEAGKRYVEAKYAEQRLAETVKKEQAEAAKQKQAEIDRDLGIAPAFAFTKEAPLSQMPEAPTTAPSPAPAASEEVPMRKEIFFKVYVSREELAGINAYLKANKITFRQMKAPNN